MPIRELILFLEKHKTDSLHSFGFLDVACSSLMSSDEIRLKKLLDRHPGSAKVAPTGSAG
jgi:hypothetical protein